MRSYKFLVSEASNLLEIKGFIEVYEELAAGKMQKIRKFILSGRDFFEALEKLSDEVGSDFETVTEAGKKTAAVFISANTGLYGEIIDKTFKQFLVFISKNESDVYIVGKLGEELMKSLAPKVAFRPLPFSDGDIVPEEFNLALSSLFPYKKIVVFYGKFYNIATQHPFVSRLSGETLSRSQNPEELAKIHFRYLYEPSLFTVSEVFAGEILTSMFDAILREAQLAKQASRLIQLDTTIENIDFSLIKITSEKRNLRKKILNKKQNSMVSGIMARV